MVKEEKTELEIKLAENTRFTDKEIKDFLKNTDGEKLKKDNFIKILGEKKIKSENLRQRMWDGFDMDDDDTVSTYEFLVTLSRLIRGTIDDVCAFFFEMYDINNDDSVSKDELTEVFSDILTEVVDREVTPEEMERVKSFFDTADANHDGKLDYEEFATAIKGLLKKQEENAPKYGWKQLTWTVILFLMTAMFEMGTSFGLPAMGALSADMKDRFDVGDSEIGLLTGLYYAAAMVGPIVGGTICVKKGPTPALILANILVLLGCFVQSLDAGFTLLIIGRLLLGLGGEVTPFTTIEVLNILFPKKYFMLCCGLRNFVQSGSGFAAFVILPALASSSLQSALNFIVLMAVLSLVFSIVAHFYIEKKKEELAKTSSAAQMFKSLAQTMVPSMPGKWADWKLPLSFYLAVYGIKAFYVPPFSFTAFSIKIFTSDQFNLSKSTAAFFSGFQSALAGVLGIFLGPASDIVGKRSLSLAGFLGFSVIAFLLFAFTEITPWVGITLMALTYGFGDTTAYVSIRLIVGEKRAGIGYGIYGMLGNFFSAVIPIIGGIVMESAGEENENRNVSLYFTGLMLIGVILWLLVRTQEGARSKLEMPEKDLVETADADIDAAAMMSVALEDGGAKKPEEKKAIEMEDVAAPVVEEKEVKDEVKAE